MTIEQIKAECRAIIEQAEKATPGPWRRTATFYIGCPNSQRVAELMGQRHAIQNVENGDFIASSRSFTPKAARALLTTFEVLAKIARDFTLAEEAIEGRPRILGGIEMSDTPETRKPCRYCGQPEANAKDWADIEPGKGEELGLCWGGEVCRHDPEEAIDRLMKERDEAREVAAQLANRLACYRHIMPVICGITEEDYAKSSEGRFADAALAAHEALTAKN